MRMALLGMTLLVACADPGGGRLAGDATSTSDSASTSDAATTSDAAATSDAATTSDDTGVDVAPDGGGPEIPPPTSIGGDRPARVITPEGYDGTTPVPAVFLLGGYDYFARDLDDWIALSDRVDALGFVLVLPDGLVDEDGSPFWNATDTCCDYYGVGVDDVAWLGGLVDELRARMAIRGVGLVGHSAGGFMAYRLACEIPGELGGIVSIAGSGFVDERDCADRVTPLSLLQVHGEDDDVMPFDGDDEAPGALEMLERFAERDGCTLRSWALEEARVDYAEEGDTQIGAYASGCTSGEDVRLWLLEGSDHYPTFTARFTDDALAWLLERL